MGLLSNLMPAAGPIGGIISTFINNNAQRKENEKAFDRNVEMWNMNNQYNSPEMQMERLKNAGLNPNLVYGNGVTGNSSGNVPNYQAPNIQRLPLEKINPMEMIGQYLDLKQKSAMADLTSENLNKVKIENSYLHALLTSKTGNQVLSAAEKQAMLGLTAKDWSVDYESGDWRTKNLENSPLMLMKRQQLAKYSAETDNANMRTILMEFERKFYENVPKEFQWLAPLLMSLFKR